MSTLLAKPSRVAFDPRIHPLGIIAEPTAGAGAIAERISRDLRRIKENRSPTVGTNLTSTANEDSLPERLHKSLAAAKILLSQVSMHLDREWRERLFRQLDNLLDADSWDEADEMLDASSFSTFLRMVLLFGINKRPALGISRNGHLLADWTVEGESLTIEFLPKDQIRWIVSRVVDEERESAAGLTHLNRLGAVLAPYQPDRWLAHADEARA